MLNTTKLLYILPDMAFLAELLPDKPSYSFKIDSFKQFNGILIKDNKFLPANLVKLFKRLDADEYSVILPDELFTNTIINVEKSSEAEVKEYLKEEVIPSLHINTESHQIETFILSEYKGVYKVQLSSVQRSLLSPLKVAIQSSQAKITKLYPLSWAIKSLISLEPSISLLQLGENLFLAKHYIGVDQPLMDSIKNLDRFVETIKTLKGTEPSTQTVYLLSDELVEEQLKEKLNGVLPVQQMSEGEGETAKMSGFVEKTIIASMKTISTQEFEIPEFTLDGVEADSLLIKDATDLEVTLNDQETPDVSSDLDAADDLEEASLAELPKPGTEAAQAAQATLGVAGSTQRTANDTKVEHVEIEETKEIDNQENSEVLKSESELEQKLQKAVPEVNKIEETDADLSESDRVQDVDLYKFASVSTTSGDQEKKEEDNSVSSVITRAPTMKTKVVKNNDGTGSFIKVILVFLGTLILTVLIGVGIGFGVLKLSSDNLNQIQSPVSDVTEEVEEVEEEVPSPTPLSAVERSEYSIRVVNATTKAGFAGQIATVLEEAGYKTVDAKNAVEDYEPGFYVLMEEENLALMKTLAEDLDLELEHSTEIKPEDPKGDFDAVVVLAN